MFIYFLILIIKIFLIEICRKILFNKLSKLNFFYFGIILGTFFVLIDIKLHDFYLDHKISILQEKNKKLEEELNNLTNKNKNI